MTHIYKITLAAYGTYEAPDLGYDPINWPFYADYECGPLEIVVTVDGATLTDAIDAALAYDFNPKTYDVKDLSVTNICYLRSEDEEPDNYVDVEYIEELDEYYDD